MEGLSNKIEAMSVIADLTGLDYVKYCIRDVPDFPRPGILFKDITPLLYDIKARAIVVDLLAAEYLDKKVEVVAAIEARGFLFGMMLAERLQVPFVPIRKAGKLPYQKKSASYSLEYGTATIEIHDDAFVPGTRVLIHDDVLATGGTAGAAATLVRDMGGALVGFSFIINLAFLPGSVNLLSQFGVEQHSLLTY
jgi:adenine phosphoribosyltransferase